LQFSAIIFTIFILKLKLNWVILFGMKSKQKMKKMEEQTSSTFKNLKREVGERFKLFRLDKKKAQHVLASELQIHQSTITNIERGTTFPKVNYLNYFYEKYGLNLNWLVSGDGGRYMEEVENKGASRIMAPDVEYDSDKYDHYQELNSLMQIPVIEQIIFAKLSECKILFKADVKKFLDNLEKEKRVKKRKASRAKVKK
jgi:transcriptional regulator with XRE-family HTH domain